jgi:hypothetical protein
MTTKAPPTETTQRSEKRNYKDDLVYSNTKEHEPFWRYVYKQAFPTAINWMRCPADTQAQVNGIDRVLLLNCGSVVKIEEKTRDRDYRDIHLEFISNDVRKTIGWIEKDLICDYIAYAVMPKNKCYIIHWTTLKTLWEHNKEEWKKKYYISKSPNWYDNNKTKKPDFHSYGVCIKTGIMRELIPSIKEITHEPDQCS